LLRGLFFLFLVDKLDNIYIIITKLKIINEGGYMINNGDFSNLKILNIEGKKVIAKRKLEDGYSIIETSQPVLLTVLGDLNIPRYPSIKRVVDAFNNKESIKVWNANDFEVDEGKLGLDASPTQVYDTFVPTSDHEAEILEGTVEEKVEKLISKLKEKKIV